MKASLLQKTAWNALASVISLFGRLIVQIMIARILGPEGIGRIAYIVWLLEIANVFSCFGLPASMTRYLAELQGQKSDKGQTSHFAQWVFFRFLMLSFIGSVGFGLLFTISSQYSGSESILPVLVLLFLAYSLQTINQSYLAGRQRFDLLARVNVVATLILVIGVSLGASFCGVEGALLGYFAGAMIPAVYSFRMLRGVILGQQIESELRRRVWKFSFNSWLAMLVTAFVWSRMEIFFIGRYWNSHEVAMFTVALTFAMVVRKVATLFSGSFMAHFSQVLGGGNHDLVQRQYETATNLMAFLVVPMAFGGAAIMPVLVPLMFGVEFALAIPNAMVLTATSGLAFSTIGSALVYAKERSGFIAISGFAGTIMSVTFGFLIIPRFGAWGAAWSQMFVQCSMVALGTWFIVTKLHYSYPFGSLGRTILAGVFCAFSAWGIIQVVSHPATALFLAVLMGVVVYVFSVKFLCVLGLEEARQLKRLTSRLPMITHKYFGLIIDAMVTDK